MQGPPSILTGPANAVLIGAGGLFSLTGEAATLTSATSSNFTWSATVTGIEKSPNTGFIAPVAWYDGTKYQSGYIFPMTTTGTVDMYFERILGETGTCSITINTSNSTNAAAGTNYNSITNSTLTWADGEIGWKKVTLTVTAIPTGFGLIQVKLTGNAYRPNTWVWLQGTGRVPTAKYFQSSNGVQITPGAAGGLGTQASPWTSLQNAISSMGASGGVLYWVQNGVNGHMEWAGTPGANNGVTVNGFLAPDSSPLIIVPDPGNTSVAFMDQGSTAGGTNILWSNAPALYFKGTGSNIWLCGLHFYRGGIQWNGQDVVQWSNCSVWQCEIDNYSVNLGSNVHCIRFEHVVNGIFQDCYAHNPYTNESGLSSNSYTAVAAGFEACLGTLRPSFCSVAHCFLKQGQFGLMNKQGPDTSTDTPCEITHCVAVQCQNSSTSGGGLTGYPVQGTAFSNGLIRYCVYDGTNDLGSGLTTGLINQFDVLASTAQNIDMYNNVVITGTNGGQTIGEIKGATGWRVFNNILQDSTTSEINVETPGTGTSSQLLFCDKNIFVRGSHTWNAGGTAYGTLALWRAATTGGVLAAPPDVNSTATSTTPSYGNVATNDYRISNSGGRGNRPIGVGIQRPGIVNNFLNTSLPTVPT